MSSPSSQLASQIPFHTQLPCSKSWQVESLPPSAQTIISVDQQQDGQAGDPNPSTFISQSHLLLQHLYPVSGSPKHDLVARGRVDAEGDVISSSNQSIECEPVPLPEENTTPELPQAQSFTSTSTHEPPQPFPLVDWIKRIRRETPKQWPTLPLRWARTISKTQRAILDDDESWLPPLPGRSARPGTVPIDILNSLTTRADQAAQALHLQEQRHQEEFIKPQKASVSASSQSLVRSHTPQAIESENLQEDKDDETVDASQWSSSPPQPPRFAVPPDTSPVRAPGHNTMQEQEQHDERTVELDSGSQETGTRRAEVPMQPQDSDQVMEIDQHNSTQSGLLIERDAKNYAVQSLSTNANVADEVNTEDMAAKDSTRTYFGPRVHVQETPYPPKPAQGATHETSTAQNLPQSSFVGATFPDPVSARSERTHRNHRQKVTFQQANEEIDLPTTNKCETPHSVTNVLAKRSRGQTNDAILPAKPCSESFLQMSDAPQSLHTAVDQKATSHVLAHSEAESDLELPVAKRPKIRDNPIQSSEPHPDPVYYNFDKRRHLERRLFRQSISKSRQSEETVDRRSKSKQIGTKSSSLASSPPQSGNRSLGYDSEGHFTSATDLSIHGPVSVRTPASKVGSRRSSSDFALNERSLSSAYNYFKNAYPKYGGDQVSFRNTIRLLLKLESRPREPHQSLWDDFIYRFADDYRSYLKDCLNTFENALPYQDYYHTFVKRSERTKEVVTKEVLLQLQGLSKSERERYQGHPSEPVPNAKENLTIETATDVISGSQTSSIERNRPKYRGQVIPETQAVTVRSSDNTPPIRLPPQHDGTKSKDIGASSSLKHSTKTRRSLPWSKEQPVQSSPLSKRLDIEKKALHITAPDRSSKVERWLFASRVAGDASPELEPMQLPLSFEAGMELDKEDDVVEMIHPEPIGVQLQISQHIEPRARLSAESIKMIPNPQSKFSQFASSYMKLQSSEALNQGQKGSRILINGYKW